MPMESNLFKNLKECDAKNSWSLVRKIVGIQLMGEDATTVPYLTEAEHYDMSAVILKEERDMKQRLQKIKPSAIPVGFLRQYIKNENKEGVLEGTKSNKVDTNLNQAYKFEESERKHQDKKSIRVELNGCGKCVMENVPTEGSLTLDIVEKGFENLKKVYLIYEVYYVDEVKIIVNINNETDTYHLNDHIPIGFRVIQYKLKANGDIGTAKDIVNNKLRVFWLSKKKIRLPMDKLPPIPNEEGADPKQTEESSGSGTTRA